MVEKYICHPRLFVVDISVLSKIRYGRGKQDAFSIEQPASFTPEILQPSSSRIWKESSAFPRPFWAGTHASIRDVDIEE